MALPALTPTTVFPELIFYLCPVPGQVKAQISGTSDKQLKFFLWLEGQGAWCS